jgi:hypothetical protein
VGLFVGLLTAPLAPVRGVIWVARTVAEQAEREMTDPARVRRELDQIEAEHARGEISDEERDRREAALIGPMLDAARGTRGGRPHGR